VCVECGASEAAVMLGRRAAGHAKNFSQAEIKRRKKRLDAVRPKRWENKQEQE